MKAIATIETLTPEWAEQEIKKQEEKIARGVYRQRNMSEATVDRYANDIKHGHWLLNNQGIGFDVDGNLIDGRHRVWAIRKAGVPVKMLVLRGLEPCQQNGILVNTIDTVDCGRNRSVGQQLTIGGIACANNVAAAVRCIATICSANESVKLSVTQVRCVLEIYGTGIRKTISNLHTNNRLMRGYFLGPVAMFRAFDSQKADAFATHYMAMVNLPIGSPILALHKYMQNNANIGSVGNGNAIRAVALAINHYAAGTKVNSIRKSPIGVDWLLDNQKNNVRKVREILGLK